MPERIQLLFKEKFGRPCEVSVRSPARVNLIGEHTDYNGGYSMPGAIAQSIWLALGTNDAGMVRAYAMDLDDVTEKSIYGLSIDEGCLWANYLFGVLEYAKFQWGFESGVDVVFGGDIPIGAGLSSSAALTCGFGAGLNAMADLNLENLEIAKAAQWSEHHFAGTQCGLMDQMANLFSTPNSAFLLEHQTLSVTPVPYDVSATSLVLFNTMVKHELANTAYNERRRVCEAAVVVLNEAGYSGKYVSDFKKVPIPVLSSLLNEEAFRLVRFILDENERVHAFAVALQQKDWGQAGALLYESHWGLSNEYRVSCEEADALVTIGKGLEGVHGGRMMGGGFGGCVLFLMDPFRVDQLIAVISKKYSERYGGMPEHYRVVLGGGTEVWRH